MMRQKYLLSFPGLLLRIVHLRAVKPEGQSPGNTLFSSKECGDDVQKYCQNLSGTFMTDVAVLRCLSDRMESLSELNTECQHVKND